MASLERDRVPSPRSIPAREIKLVDRAEEMKLLKEAVDRAVLGEGGLVFVYGEAGIGKTRLARELRAYAHLRGMHVLYGRCPALFRMDGVPPYVLWREVIREYLETCTPEQLYGVIGLYPAEVAKLVPELAQKIGTIPQSFPISPDQEQNRLFEAVSQFITNISREAPLLVILDDLQWTDSSSLLLLPYLARGTQKTPLLFLGAYRSTDIDTKHPLKLVLTELNRERLLQSVSLKRMSIDDVSEMIKQILEQKDIPTEFCGMVYEKTRGNPFFAEEVIKSLKEEDLIYRKDSKWEIKEVTEIELPETVKNVVKARIDRLDDECQKALTMASIVGNDFTFEALQGVTGVEEDKLRKITDELLKTGLLKHRVVHGKDVCSFVDIIVRDVVYEEVGTFERKKLHKVVGAALEKVYAQRVDEHLGELALHFLEGGDKDKALDYFLKAGEKAQKVYAYVEALSYLQRALELLEEKGDYLEERASIIERLGDLKVWSGEIEAGMEYLDKSLTYWIQLDDKKSISSLHLKMAHILWDVVGDKERASEHHRVSLDILEKEPESVELARLYEDISHMLWRTGEYNESLTWTQKALALAEKFSVFDVLASCYNNLGMFSRNSGELDKAVEYFGHGLKIALENKLVEHSLHFYNNFCLIYSATGEYQKFFKTAKEGSEIAKNGGSLYYLARLELWLSGSYQFMGDLQKAISMGEDVLALATRIKYTTYIPYVMWVLGLYHHWSGEWDQSLKYLTEALNSGKKVGEYQQSGYATSELGALFMEMKNYDEAEKYLKESNIIYEEAEDTDNQMTGPLPTLSRLYLEKGEIDKARELIEKIYEYATKTKNRLATCDAELLKAMLFKEQKNWEQSIQQFERSLLEAKVLDAPKWYVFQYAEILYEYGLMYLERNEEGDKERSHSLLNQALDIYQRAGAKKRIENIKSQMIHLRTGQQAIKLEPTATDVSEILVPACINTGYANLDKLLLGGIPEKYAVVLTSPSCNERDLMIKKFLEAGVRKGEVTFHITIDPSEAKGLAEEFPANFYLFICNPHADAIVKDSPNVFKLKGVENLTDISIALTLAIRKLDPSLKGLRRICMGSISDILLQHHAVQTRRWLAALIPELKSQGFTTLAVIDPQIHRPEELHAILGLFQGEINIREKETEKGSEKFLKIKRMSNQKYLEDELPLKKEQK